MATTFHITVTPQPNGHLPAMQRTSITNYLRSEAGVELEIEIRRRKSQRSLDQNAWIWGVAYPLLAETLGYDRDEVEDLHYALVEKWGGTHWDPRMRSMVPNKRSSKLTTAEFSDYMEWLTRFAAKEFGCVIPLPDERAA
jgi:hypothetical protein